MLRGNHRRHPVVEEKYTNPFTAPNPGGTSCGRLLRSSRHDPILCVRKVWFRNVVSESRYIKPRIEVQSVFRGNQSVLRGDCASQVAVRILMEDVLCWEKRWDECPELPRELTTEEEVLREAHQGASRQEISQIYIPARKELKRYTDLPRILSGLEKIPVESEAAGEDVFALIYDPVVARAMPMDDSTDDETDIDPDATTEDEGEPVSPGPRGGSHADHGEDGEDGSFYSAVSEEGRRSSGRGWSRRLRKWTSRCMKTLRRMKVWLLGF